MPFHIPALRLMRQMVQTRICPFRINGQRRFFLLFKGVPVFPQYPHKALPLAGRFLKSIAESKGPDPLLHIRKGNIPYGFRKRISAQHHQRSSILYIPAQIPLCPFPVPSLHAVQDKKSILQAFPAQPGSTKLPDSVPCFCSNFLRLFQ